MSEAAQTSWHEANQRYLARAIGEVRAQLEAFVRGQGQGAAPALEDTPPRAENRPALETVCEAFGLSSFERSVLLMCAGAEMDSRFGELFASGSTRAGQPTFSLALAAFADAHWSALAPSRPLRHWNLVELRPGEALTTSPLRIDEKILHFLVGVQTLDERLAGLLQPVAATDDLAPSHQQIAERIVALWSRRTSVSGLHVVELCGEESIAKRAIAASAAGMLGWRLHVLPAWRLPRTSELDTTIRLWEREAVLSASALLVESDEQAGETASALAYFLETVRSPLFVAARNPRGRKSRPAVIFEIGKVSAAEQAAVWHSALGNSVARLNGSVDALVSQFSLDQDRIRSAAGQAQAREDSAGLAEFLWETCRLEARPRLEGLAQRIETVAAWDDLVLPAKQKELLRNVAMHVRRRRTVYHEWGFAGRSSRGLGISALFAGPSGTGKTLAAEVLANDLRLDLYRIDLSQVVSKYIGETEKNLRRVFDAADEGAAVLLFDEADALFGKRTEVKDSHDRYANIEVSYLLQRMEAYRGLAILTTNRKNALDQAFLRRIRFVVDFPFPDAAERAEIWRRIFPAATPTEGLRVDRLARLSAAGGNIRNIALGAAFLAADAGEPVRMIHLLSATRHEFAKIEKPLSDVEVSGWL